MSQVQNQPDLGLDSGRASRRVRIPLECPVHGKQIKRGLEYGVRAPGFYGNLREQTGENGFPRIHTGSLFRSYRNLRKPPGVYGIM